MSEPFTPWTRNRALALVGILLLICGLLFTKAGHNFTEAWRLWATAGKPISDYHLWHLPVFWWARIGKMLEAAGVFFLLFDAFGYSSTRAFLRMLSEPSTVHGHIDAFRDACNEVRKGLHEEPITLVLTFLNNYLFALVITGFVAVPIFHVLMWKSHPAGPVPLENLEMSEGNRIILLS